MKSFYLLLFSSFALGAMYFTSAYAQTVTGDYSRQGSAAQANNPAPSFANNIRPSTIATGGDYVLRSNDVVSVIVFGEPDLECIDRIAADGTISMPLVGRLKIGGKTPVGASDIIRAALQADYLVNPQVSLAVTEATKQYYTLLGQVATPGTYILPPTGKLSLLQAIGMGGGFTRMASTSKITVKRLVGGQEKIFKVDAAELSSGTGKGSFEVLPGDVITVKERLF